MHSDEPFLRKIVATPDDDAPRHIYADYLEESGDSRAQYVRLAATVQPIQYFGWLSESSHKYYVERFPMSKSLADAWHDAKSNRMAMQRLRAGLEPGWLAMMDTFGCLRQRFEFFNNTGPNESIPRPNPFVEQLCTRGAAITFETDFLCEEVFDDGLVKDMEVLCGLELADCCYGAASCPTHPFVCEVRSNDRAATARRILEALRIKEFRSQHIPDLDRVTLPYPGYHPGPDNDEIHTDFHEQSIFAHRREDRGDYDTERFEYLAGEITPSEESHGDLVRHVRDNRMWYVLLHDWEQNSGARQKGFWVVLLAIGLSPHGDRLIGTISHQICLNLCD